MANSEPLTTDPQIIGELLTELDHMAEQWATYHDRHPASDSTGHFADRDQGYRAGLQICASQLRDMLRRQRSYAEASSDEWDVARPASQTRLTDA